MRMLYLALFLTFSRLGVAQSVSRLESAGGTLVLVGFTSDSVVVMADTEVISEDLKKVGNQPKLYRVGNVGVVANIGKVRIANRGVWEVNFGEIARRCAGKSVTLDAVESCIQVDAGKAFPHTISNAPPVIVGALIAGFRSGRAALDKVVVTSEAGTKVIRVTASTMNASPGQLQLFGNTDFAKALRDGKLPNVPTSAQTKLYHDRVQSKTLDRYTSGEMAELEQYVLGTTESSLGKRYNVIGVGGPNNLVVIGNQTGYRKIE